MSTDNSWFKQTRVVQHDLTRVHAMLARLHEHAAVLLGGELAPNPTLTDPRIMRLPLSMFVECVSQLQDAIGKLVRSSHYRGFLLTAEHLDVVEIAPPSLVVVADVVESSALLRAAVMAVRDRDLRPLAKLLFDAGLITKQEAEGA